MSSKRSRRGKRFFTSLGCRDANKILHGDCAMRKAICIGGGCGGQYFISYSDRKSEILGKWASALSGDS